MCACVIRNAGVFLYTVYIMHLIFIFANIILMLPRYPGLPQDVFVCEYSTILLKNHTPHCHWDIAHCQLVVFCYLCPVNVDVFWSLFSAGKSLTVVFIAAYFNASESSLAPLTP